MIAIQGIRKKNVSIFIAVTLFLLFPVASLPFILYGIYNREKVAYVLFCLFMGLIGFLYSPFGDLYRYHLMFESIKHMSLVGIFNKYNAQETADYVLPLITWCVGQFGLPVDWVRFLFNALGFGIVCSMHNTLCSYNTYNNRTSNFFCFLSLWFVTGAVYMLYRWGFAVNLFVWAVCIIEIKHKKTGWFVIALAGLCHSALWFIIIIYLIYRIRKYVFSKTVLIVFFIITLFASMSFVAQLFENFDILGIYDRFIIYVSEGAYWNSGYLNDRSDRKIIYDNISNIPIYIAWILIILDGKKSQPIKWVIHMMCFVLVIIAGFPNLTLRITAIFSKLFVVYFFYNTLFINFYSKKRAVFTLILAISFMSNIYGTQKRSFIWGNTGKIFYSSLYQIVSSPYGDSWMFENINNIGDWQKTLNNN